jgi:DNA-binding transcriptional LysR family regulator
MQNTDVDLNLLRMLRVLLNTASITKSGEQLGLSQPAASRTMSKLRDAFKDPLLVRTSKGYVLTPLAESLRPSVDAALSAAQNVFAQQSFDPHTSSRQFRLCSTDYGEAIVLQPLSAALERVAPQISCHVSSWNDNTLHHLENGVLDLALYVDADLPADFHSRDLFVDQYALIVRHGHPLDGRIYKKLADFLQEVSEFSQVVTSYPKGRGFAVDNVLQRLGHDGAHVAFTTPYFSNAPSLVAHSDYVMLLPKRMAQLFARHWPISVIEIPSQQESFQYRMIWHERAHRDQGLKWLREQTLAHVLRQPS